MLKAIYFAIVLISSSSLLLSARGQIIYKCGDSYSAQACPGGITVNAADARTSDQKEQADRSTARDIRSANAQESARLQQEAKELAANTPARQALNTNPRPDKKIVQRDKKIKSIRIKTPPVKKTITPAKKNASKKVIKT